MTMKFVKQSFMGIELDVLIGHPEHRLLFIATQVAKAAGLKNPAVAINVARRNHGSGGALETLILPDSISLPVDAQGRRIRSTTVLFTDSETYQMLLRGHAPQSEPFRKWVTEEVIPSIVEKGSYNIHESETKEAQQFAGEFAQLHSAISELTSEVLSLKEIIAGCQKPSL
ncbi:BRO family protein [Pseudomonas sp. NBRC 111134]|uniref:BRO family protein n=1 Tax=Pseudomonas sp. NBRC 111134 TaxID=1661049 RepID=UPI000761F881|nr:BRO family protein [Pseudomonas sp. NBRC 111134]